MGLKSFFRELKRRNIYKVAVAYGITGWIIIQIATSVFPALEFPQWTTQFVIILVLIGLPISLVFAWAFEITPDGIKRTREVPLEESVSSHTGKKLNYWIIGLLSLALLLVLAERIWFAGTYSSSSESSLDTPVQEAASVAVLPFDDFSPEGDQQWFSDGLTEEILNSLARLQGLEVPARTSSFLFRDSNLPVTEIADSLGVNHVVEGSVRRAGNNMRITAQLIRGKDGNHIWSNTYDRHIDSVFKVQEDIAEKIAGALDIYLDEDDRKKMFTFGTRNVDAYNAYLKGRSIYDQVHDQNLFDYDALLQKANPWFEKAIAQDPNFAAPYYFHHDGYAHYLQNYPQNKIASLSGKKAYRLLLADLNHAIQYANSPELKTMYEFERVQYSKNWSQVPKFINRLKKNTKAQRAYNIIEGGWFKDLLNIAGYAELQFRLDQNALKNDPLDSSLKTAAIRSLFYFASTDTILSTMNKYKLRGAQAFSPALFFRYLRSEQWDKADSLAQIMNSFAPNIILRASQGKKVNLDKELAEVPDSLKPPALLCLLNYAVGNRQEANKIAHSLDSKIELLGPQKLSIGSSQITGGYLGFDPDSLTNIGRMFKEADIEVKQTKLGKTELPQIVQKR